MRSCTVFDYVNTRFSEIKMLTKKVNKVTPFGKMLRTLRVQTGDSQEYMAIKVLKTSGSYLSAVENGIKNVPPTWIDDLAEHYQLTPRQAQKMREAADISVREVTISLNGLSEESRKDVLTYVKKLEMERTPVRRRKSDYDQDRCQD